MASLWVLTLALIAGAASTSGNRIVGGQPTTIDKYPSIVQVEYRNPITDFWFQACGATILTTRHVLSAAHCFHGPLYQPENRRIRAGSSYLNTGGMLVYVKNVVNHPSYGLRGYDGDISIVRLLTSLVYSPVIQRIAIPPQGSIIPDDLPVVKAGWGVMRQGSFLESYVLRDVHIFTINNALCTARYASLVNRQPVTENMICAGLLDIGGRDACQGDSGGPLYYGNIIIGVISWGEGCANATYPGVNINVASYSDWIVANAI